MQSIWILWREPYTIQCYRELLWMEKVSFMSIHWKCGKNCMDRTSREHIKPVRQKWFGVACCPPNIARTLASLGQYLYFQEKDTFYINLYIGNTTEFTLGNSLFKLNMDSMYPWEGKITIHLSSEEKAYGTLAFRVPAGSSNFQVCINGEIIKTTQIENNYFKISREFGSDKIEISFEMPAVFVHANPAVRADTGKVALMKGPLVYCLEEVDNGDNLASIYVSSNQTIQESYSDNLLQGTVKLHLKGKNSN